MADEAKKNNFVSRVVVEVQEFLETYGNMQALRDEWDALGYSSAIVEGDLSGANEAISPAELAAVFTSIAAIKAVMDAGHKTNLFRVVP